MKGQHIRIAWASLLAGAAIFASPAQAQRMIGEGMTDGEGRGGVDCYMFETTAGEHWQVALNSVTFDPYLTIGHGPSCEAMTIDLNNDDGGEGLNARTSFTAGGGIYYIQVRAYADVPRGPYLLSLSRVTRAPRRLPPGVPLPPALRDTDAAGASVPADAAAAVTQAAGTRFSDCADVCPQMVVVPAGRFMIGSPASEAGRDNDEGPQREISIGRAYAIGTHEVTFAQYDACVADGGCAWRPSDQDWGRGNRPVIDVSWVDAQAYVEWLSRKTGQRYLLPSEAEWEYAARAGSVTAYAGGAELGANAANIDNQLLRTVPVGGFAANRWGLFDVHGNVAEWVRDCYDVGYFDTPANGGAALRPLCRERVVRGGSFSERATAARSAARARRTPMTRMRATGFRVVRAL